MTFFRQKVGAASGSTGLGYGTGASPAAGEAQVITEGTLVSTSSIIGYDTVLATMLQYGGVYEYSDIYGMTALFNVMNGIRDRISEVVALHAEEIVRNILAGSGTAGATANAAFFNRMYAQGAASFAALSAAAAGSVELTVQDMLRAFTQLQINRAPKKNGKYYMYVPPQVAYNLMLDPKWLNIGFYQDKSQMVKGEVGQLYGVSIVIGTDPFRETSGGTEGTYSATGTIYDSFALGSESFSTPIMAGQSPYSPNVIVVNTPDKTDVLNQLTVIGWKAYWCAITLNNTWGINMKAKTSFA